MRGIRLIRSRKLAVGWVATLLLACSPTFNWREARLDDTPLVALLPCKPDRATRTVPLGGTPVSMRMMGCEAGGVQFAVAAVPLPNVAQAAQATQATELLTQWRMATLGNFAAVGSAPQPFAPKGASGASQGQVLATHGRQSDGRAVRLQVAWFRHGAHIYQVLAYGETLSGEVAETFLGSVALQ